MRSCEIDLLIRDCSGSFPRVQNGYAAGGEVGFVAGDDGEAVDEGGGGDEGVDGGHGRAGELKVCRESRPCHEAVLIQRKDAAGKGGQEVGLEPGREFGAFARGGAELDAFPSLANGDDAEKAF